MKTFGHRIQTCSGNALASTDGEEMVSLLLVQTN